MIPYPFMTKATISEVLTDQNENPTDEIRSFRK